MASRETRMTAAEARENGDTSVCFQSPPPSEWQRAADALAYHEARAEALKADAELGAQLRRMREHDSPCANGVLCPYCELDRLREIAGEYRELAEVFGGDAPHLDPTLADLRARLAALSLPAQTTVPPGGT